MSPLRDDPARDGGVRTGQPGAADCYGLAGVFYAVAWTLFFFVCKQLFEIFFGLESRVVRDSEAEFTGV